MSKTTTTAREPRSSGLFLRLFLLCLGLGLGGMVGLLLVIVDAGLAFIPVWVRVVGWGAWGSALAWSARPAAGGLRPQLLHTAGLVGLLQAMLLATPAVLHLVAGLWEPAAPLRTPVMPWPAIGDPAFDQMVQGLTVLVRGMLTYSPLICGGLAWGLALVEAPSLSRATDSI